MTAISSAGGRSAAAPGHVAPTNPIGKARMRLTEPALPQDSEATPGAASTIPTSTTPRLLVPVAATRPSLPAPSPSLPDAETAPIAVAPTIPATASGFPPGYAAPTSWYARRGKRLFDLAFTSCVLVVAAPVMLGVFVALRFAFPGESIVLRQRRVGLNGQDFDMLKFRTMHCLEHDESVQAVKGDQRVFRGGHWLRKHSIDELQVTVRLIPWAAPPGAVALVKGEGPADGKWLVRSIQSGLLGEERSADIVLGRPQAPKKEPASTVSSRPPRRTVVPWPSCSTLTSPNLVGWGCAPYAP